jgi:hypothetical protein
MVRSRGKRRVSEVRWQEQAQSLMNKAIGAGQGTNEFDCAVSDLMALCKKHGLSLADLGLVARVQDSGQGKHGILASGPETSDTGGNGRRDV